MSVTITQTISPLEFINHGNENERGFSPTRKGFCGYSSVSELVRIIHVLRVIGGIILKPKFVVNYFLTE